MYHCREYELPQTNKAHHSHLVSRRSLPLILVHTRALRTYLSGDYLPCKKITRCCFFFKIKVNACILTRPLNNHKFEGIIYKYFVLFIVHFFLIPQLMVTNGLKATWKKNELFSFHLKRRLRFKHNAEIYPPGTWVEIINSTLEPLNSTTLKPTNMQSHPSKLF